MSRYSRTFLMCAWMIHCPSGRWRDLGSWTFGALSGISIIGVSGQHQIIQNPSAGIFSPALALWPPLRSEGWEERGTLTPLLSPLRSGSSPSPLQSPLQSRSSQSPLQSPLRSRSSQSPLQSPLQSRSSQSPLLSPLHTRSSPSPLQSPLRSRSSPSPLQSPLRSRSSPSPLQSPLRSRSSQSPLQSPLRSRSSKSPLLNPLHYGSSKSPLLSPLQSGSPQSISLLCRPHPGTPIYLLWDRALSCFLSPPEVAITYPPGLLYPSPHTCAPIHTHTAVAHPDGLFKHHTPATLSVCILHCSCFCSWTVSAFLFIKPI